MLCPALRPALFCSPCALSPPTPATSDCRHYAQSLEAYEASISLDPTVQGPWANLGRALVGMRDLALAAEALAQSLYIEPDQHELRLYYGEVLHPCVRNMVG